MEKWKKNIIIDALFNYKDIRPKLDKSIGQCIKEIKEL